MIYEFEMLRAVARVLMGRLAQAQAEPEAGYSTEAVVVTALLVTLALTAMAIIAAKVLGAAGNINTQ
jgi:hypothetical protein